MFAGANDPADFRAAAKKLPVKRFCTIQYMLSFAIYVFLGEQVPRE
jgi:hypothetical protein